MKKRRTHTGARDYPRTARLNHLFQEIIAEELERIDDERLALVTVMGVTVDADLRHAVVYVEQPDGAAEDATVLEALGAHRGRLQGAIGRQARVRRVPELAFRPDEASRSAARVEDILRDLDP